MEKDNGRIVSEELTHLEFVQGIIKEKLDDVENTLERSRKDIRRQKRYLWENLYELDPEEIAANRVSISEEHDSHEFREEQRRLLLRLLDNTYFGRIDFVYEGETEAEQIYIGLGGLKGKNGVDPVIYDWRAPIASMYYDFELGKAWFEAPMGRIDGDIIQKRQLKIRKGILEYAFDSQFRVDDGVLQKELSGNSSPKMRNIVATIQREQNRIVRDEASDILLVQGVAGSGKTSIALHRIAFLLYQNRKNLQASDILILSPNRIFADYISNVLPELGEQNIAEVSFDEIAQHELRGICKYESKYQQMEYIIECRFEDEERLKRIRFKNSIAFLEKIKEYVKKIEAAIMNFESYQLNDYVFGKETMETMYGKIFAQEPVFERLDQIGDRIADIYESERNAIVSVSTRNEIKQSIRGMARTTDVIVIYRQFLEWLGGQYAVMKNDRMENPRVPYEDVFPIILLKLMLNGKKSSQYDRMKHVIVDEMQDYSMVQYEILHLLFRCKMTILGDLNQVVDRSNEVALEQMQKIFGTRISLIKLTKSYRSTFEISEFCRKLCGLSQTESFERHGKQPLLAECADYLDMIKKVQKRMDQVDLSQTTTVAVICKTATEADQVYRSLDDDHRGKCYRMNSEDADFREGIVITNSFFVKGLEFDHVIIPGVSADSYATERDRQILYIACTRALHELELLYYGVRSRFLDKILS